MFFVHIQFTTNIYTPCVNVCNNMMVLLASVAFLPCCKLFGTIVSNKCSSLASIDGAVAYSDREDGSAASAIRWPVSQYHLRLMTCDKVLRVLSLLVWLLHPVWSSQSVQLHGVSSLVELNALHIYIYIYSSVKRNSDRYDNVCHTVSVIICYRCRRRWGAMAINTPNGDDSCVPQSFIVSQTRALSQCRRFTACLAAELYCFQRLLVIVLGLKLLIRLVLP